MPFDFRVQLNISRLTESCSRLQSSTNRCIAHGQKSKTRVRRHLLRLQEGFGRLRKKLRGGLRLSVLPSSPGFAELCNGFHLRSVLSASDLLGQRSESN